MGGGYEGRGRQRAKRMDAEGLVSHSWRWRLSVDDRTRMGKQSSGIGGNRNGAVMTEWEGGTVVTGLEGGVWETKVEGGEVKTELGK